MGVAPSVCHKIYFSTFFLILSFREMLDVIKGKSPKGRELMTINTDVYNIQ